MRCSCGIIAGAQQDGEAYTKRNCDQKRMLGDDEAEMVRLRYWEGVNP